MDSQPKPEFSERLFPIHDCLLVMDRYPKLDIYYSLTKEGHFKLKAQYLLNKTQKVVTSHNITKLIGVENFNNTFIVCNQVSDVKRRLLLIMGLLTDERLNDPSKTKSVQCQTKISHNDFAKLNGICNIPSMLSKNTMNKEPSPQKPRFGYDFNFELANSHMQYLNNEKTNTKKNVTEISLVQSGRKGDNFSQSGSDKVVQNEELSQSGSVKNSNIQELLHEIRAATRLSSLYQIHHNLHQLCKKLKSSYPAHIVTLQLTSILHDTLHTVTYICTLLECVLVLLEYGADMFVKINGSTALHIIAEKSPADVAGLVVNCILKAGKVQSSKYGFNSISECIGYSFDIRGYNPIMVAALSCNHEVLDLFLESFPQLVNITTRDQSAYSALTLVTTQAIEYHLQNDNFEPYINVLNVLGKYKADPKVAVLRVKSSYVKDITPFRDFFHKCFIVKDKLANDNKVKIAVTPFGRVIRSYRVENDVNMTNNSIVIADLKDRPTVSGLKAVTNEKINKIATDTPPSKRDQSISGLPKSVQKELNSVQKSTKTTVINNQILTKNILELTKNSDKPVLVKINKKDLTKQLKVVPMESIKFKITNNELANIKDALVRNSTKNPSGFFPKIVKVESQSNIDSGTNKPSPSTNKEHSNLKFVMTPESSIVASDTIVKTEAVDETDVIKEDDNMKIHQILKLNVNSCETNEIGTKRTLESHDLVVAEKKSKKTDSTNSLVLSENQIGNEDDERTISIKSEKMTDIFEDIKEIDDLLTGNIEDKIIFDSSNSESEDEIRVE